MIKSRRPFNFELGKISIVRLIGHTPYDTDLVVRQHGTSRFLDERNIPNKNSSSSTESIHDMIYSDKDESYEWAQEIINNDKHRAMSVAILDNEEWKICSIYTFDNPLRQQMPDVINFFKNKHIPVNILTGDSRDTAEDIAKNVGFPEMIKNIATHADIREILETSKIHKCSISIEGSILETLLNNEQLTTTFLNNQNIYKVIYKANKNTKENIVKCVKNCLYVGDAKNDELAIKHAYIGISLAHGAETCRIYASLCIKQPLDLIDLLTNNGYKDMLLLGGQKLLKDVCFFGGLICGCLLVGIHLNNFEFLNKSYLYKDVWSPLSMLMISSVQYTLSSIAYSSSNCHGKRNGNFKLFVLSVVNNLFGLSIGIVVSWIIKNGLPMVRFDNAIIHAINVIILIKHSLHCLKKPVGTQVISNSNKIIGFCMNIIDTIHFRILLYIFFCMII